MRTATFMGLLSLLALTACTMLEPVPEPAPSTAVSETPSPTIEPVPPVEPSTVQESPDQGPDADQGEPVPDPALVASMECEPISDATRLSHESRWGAVDWNDAVQVPVGEGLTPGELWWVTVSTTDGETGRARLTNAGSLDDPTQADWLIASDWESRSQPGVYWKYYPSVAWEAEGQQRLYAATAKGFECLNLTYPEPIPEP